MRVAPTLNLASVKMPEEYRWKAWRVFCPDWKTVSRSLADSAGPILEELEKDGLIVSWYVSRKSEGPPNRISFRIYVRFSPKEEDILTKRIEDWYANSKSHFHFGSKGIEKDVLPGNEDAAKLKHASKLAISLLRKSKKLPIVRESILRLLEDLEKSGHLDQQSEHFVMNILGLPG